MAKILVVDDAKVMRFHISKLLKELGHTVIAQAKDGYEAIEEYKKERPDFVTMDVEMPPVNGVQNGIDAAEKIVEIDPTAVVIMISSQTDDGHIADALRHGAKNYIRKPITSDKLDQMIKYLSK